MKMSDLSIKQQQVLCSVLAPKKYVILDGAVRSGKTFIGAMAFVIWAMENHNGERFGVCGKTVTSAYDNVIKPLEKDKLLPYSFKYLKSEHTVVVSNDKRKNYFKMYGGKDERAVALIQGATLAGIFFDETTLLPRNFVEMGISRCMTFNNKRIFFTMNPDSPKHWFFGEWIEKLEEKQALRIQFKLTDNPILDKQAIEEAERLYSGVFYDRNICGEWVIADGLVYACFSDSNLLSNSSKKSGIDREFLLKCIKTGAAEAFLGVDYGITNPFSAHVYCIHGGVCYVLAEYYYDSNDHGKALTDAAHYDNLDRLLINLKIDNLLQLIIIDPSATSFKELITDRDKYAYRNADNDVIPGISRVAGYIDAGKIVVDDSCEHMLEEFGLYRWDTDAVCDSPVKEFDHSMDELRYFVNTIFRYEEV